MDHRVIPQRSSKSKKKNCHVQSIGSGEISRGRVRTSVKSLASGSMGVKKTSLASGTLSESRSSVNLSNSLALTDSTKDTSYSMGSMMSADSFVVFDVRSDSEESNDPYLDRRRRRVKPEPRIPRYHPPEEYLFDDLVTASTSPEMASPPLSPGGTATLMTASFPKTLRVPAKKNFTRDDASTASHATPSARELEQLQKAQQEYTFWNSLVTARSMTYGIVHRQTAEAIFNLGHAHMRMNNCEEALKSFDSAGEIWRCLEGPIHLSVGRALDAYGLAALRSEKTDARLRQAKSALDEAFAIRFHNLGVWHVDTVETFNKIASVHLHMRNFREACRAYEEVYLVRKAIFGMKHPSVAISAHSLANVHLKLSEPKESSNYYDIALDIYTNMNLSNDHPTVARLLRDRKRLERICMTMKPH